MKQMEAGRLGAVRSCGMVWAKRKRDRSSGGSEMETPAAEWKQLPVGGGRREPLNMEMPPNNRAPPSEDCVGELCSKQTSLTICFLKTNSEVRALICGHAPFCLEYAGAFNYSGVNSVY